MGGDSEGPELGAPASRWKASWPSCFLPITGPGLGKVPPVCGFLVVLQRILAEALPFLQAGPSPRAPGPPLTLPGSELDPKDRGRSKDLGQEAWLGDSTACWRGSPGGTQA